MFGRGGRLTLGIPGILGIVGMFGKVGKDGIVGNFGIVGKFGIPGIVGIVVCRRTRPASHFSTLMLIVIIMINIITPL